MRKGLCACSVKWRLAAVALSVVIVVVLIHQVNLWNVEISYRQYTGCSEVIYNYENQGVHVHTDLNLRQTCAKNMLTQNQNQTKANILNNQLKVNEKRIVFTKCRTVIPKLISFKQSSDSLNKFNAKYKVPNVVHFVSIGRWEFSFLNYLSILSAHKFIKPWAIYMHGDTLPFGEWWDKTIQEIPEIFHVSRDAPTILQGKQVGWLEHSSDVLRLQTLYDNGGIYLDTDVLVLKSFDNLRKHDLVLGRETVYGLGSGIIISSPHSTFLCIWKETFRNYSPRLWNWATYAVWTPSKLAQEVPDLIHIENNTLQKPCWNEPELLFNKVYDWSSNYAIHVWKRFGEVPVSPDGIKGLNTTLGEAMRYIYYGSSKLVTEGKHIKEKSYTKWSLSIAVDIIGSKIITFFS